MRITTTPGLRTTALPQVKVGRVETTVARRPVIYNPGIVILLQGRKMGYVGDRVISYDADNYFVTAIPMQFECETLGSKENPLISLTINLELNVLRELVLQIDMKPNRERALEGCYATPITPEILDCLDRMMNILAPASEGVSNALVEAQILGPQLIREIYYRVLQGPHGASLYALATRHNHLSDMNTVLDLIHQNYSNELNVEDLAKSLNVSTTTFHQYFKELTATSPIQYVKSLRLHKAKLFMVQDGFNASEASEKVGYNSLSQFSREFKRMFGSSPTDEVAKTRALYGMEPAELLSIS